MVRLAALVMFASLPAAAQEGITLDLNRLDQVDSACRLTFVIDNALAPVTALSLETVAFDQAGRVAALSLFDFGALPGAARRVRQFDLADLACADLAQVLVNGVASCTGDGLDSAACARALQVGASAPGVEMAQ